MMVFETPGGGGQGEGVRRGSDGDRHAYGTGAVLGETVQRLSVIGRGREIML